MGADPGDIEQLIRKTLPDAEVSLSDLRGDGSHYAAYVVSSAFKGKTRVEQHRMVYSALEGRLGEDGLQALALQTAVPED